MAWQAEASGAWWKVRGRFFLMADAKRWWIFVCDMEEYPLTYGGLPGDRTSISRGGTTLGVDVCKSHADAALDQILKDAAR